MRLRKLPLFIILGFSLIFILNNTASGRPKAAKDDLYNQIEIFSDAISAIQMEYVDTVPSKDIIYGALKGMLSSLDPYSQFMDQDTYNELQVETVGEFGGLGIEITIKDDLLTIISPLDGTPAHKVGLKALDRIIKINGKITRDMNLTDAVKNMRGKPGTDVTLTIMREGVDELKDYVITRDIINIKSVRKAEILENKIGYIKLTDFSEKTKTTLMKRWQCWKKKAWTALYSTCAIIPAVC
jgi:Periplasmic protease